MTACLQPYPDYKDSGLPWLGRVPAHWEIRRAKYLFGSVDIRSTSGKEELLTVSSKRGVVPRSSMKVTMFKAESYIGHKLCWPSDLVINSLWAWARGLGVSKHHGLISSAYGVYRLRDGFEQYADFIHHLVRSTAFHWELHVRSKGVWISRLQLTDDAFLDAPIPLPPATEATTMLMFLNTIERRINRFIRNRRRLIEVLNEQKQAIINRAVTRGLDPDVPLKPSGIEWLGDVPEHWKAVKIKRIALINPSRAEAFHLRELDEPVVFLPMERVSPQGEVDATERRPIHEVWQGFTYFRRGDVVVAKITPCFENGKGACLSDLPTEIGFGTTEFIVLRPRPEITAEFLYQLTQIDQFRLLGVESMTGAAGQQRVSPTFVANFVVPVPAIVEQEEIVSYIKSETSKFQSATSRAQREIDLIREYRTRLIADVVTGKVDVRHLAPHPEAMVGEAEPEDLDEGLEDEIPGEDEAELVEEG
jgi:type I restriction enzyme S subunit